MYTLNAINFATRSIYHARWKIQQFLIFLFEGNGMKKKNQQRVLLPQASINFHTRRVMLSIRRSIRTCSTQIPIPRTAARTKNQKISDSSVDSSYPTRARWNLDHGIWKARARSWCCSPPWIEEQMQFDRRERFRPRKLSSYEGCCFGKGHGAEECRSFGSQHHVKLQGCCDIPSRWLP